MKKIVLFSFVIISVMACKKDCDHDDGTKPTCTPELTKGLLAYFPFNGNFNDESGNGNNATSKNGAYLTTDFLGRTSKAAGFDGVNDYIIVPGNSKLNADSITVSYQVMVNNASRNNAAISRINFETGQSLVFNIHQSLPLNNAWTFSVTPGADNCSKIYSTDTSLYAYSKGPIQAGRWYNVIASFAGGTQKIYVDGVLEVTRTKIFTTAKKCDNADFIIGGWWKNDILSIDGKIDEVRLYGRVLTDCEIAKLAETFMQ